MSKNEKYLEKITTAQESLQVISNNKKLFQKSYIETKVRAGRYKDALREFYIIRQALDNITNFDTSIMFAKANDRHDENTVSNNIDKWFTDIGTSKEEILHIAENLYNTALFLAQHEIETNEEELSNSQILRRKHVNEAEFKASLITMFTIHAPQESISDFITKTEKDMYSASPLSHMSRRDSILQALDGKWKLERDKQMIDNYESVHIKKMFPQP